VSGALDFFCYCPADFVPHSMQLTSMKAACLESNIESSEDRFSALYEEPNFDI